MTYLAFGVLLLAWGLTIAALIVERKERMAQQTRAVDAERVIRAVSTVVARNQQLNEPAAIDPKVRPMVQEAMTYEMTGHQKRMQVMLRMLREHPGSSVNAIEQAIERVLEQERGANAR